MAQLYSGTCHYDLTELARDGRWLSKSTPSNRVTRYCPYTFPTVTGQCTVYIFPGSLASGGLVGVICHYNNANIITKYERMYYNVNTDDEGCEARNIVTKVSAISSTVATGNAAISGTINACIPCDNATKIIGGPESLSYTRLLSVATPLDQISGVPASTGVSCSFYYLDQCYHQIGSTSSSVTENSDPQSTVWSYESAMSYNGFNIDPNGISVIATDADPVPGFTSGPIPFVSIGDIRVVCNPQFSGCFIYDLATVLVVEYHAKILVYNKNSDLLWSEKTVLGTEVIDPPIIPGGTVQLWGANFSTSWIISQKNFVTNSDGNTYDMIDHIEIEYHIANMGTVVYNTTPYEGRLNWELTDRLGNIEGIGSRYLMIGFKGFSDNQQVTCNIANIVDFKVDAPRCASFEPNASVFDPECRSAFKQVMNNPGHYGWSQLTTPVELRNNMRMLEMALSLAVDEAHQNWEDFIPRAAQYALNQEDAYDKAMLSDYARMYPERAGSSAQMSMKSMLRSVNKAWSKVPKPIQSYTKDILNGAKTNLKRIGAEELNNILRSAGAAINDGSMFYDPLGTGERILVNTVKDTAAKTLNKKNFDQFKKDVRASKKTMMDGSIGQGVGYQPPRFMVLESNRPRQTFMSGPIKPGRVTPINKSPETCVTYAIPKNVSTLVPGINVSAITREASKSGDMPFEKVVSILAARQVADIGDAWVIFPLQALPKEAPRTHCSTVHGGKKFYNWSPSSKDPKDRLTQALKTDMVIASVVKQDTTNWYVDLKPVADGRSVELAIYVWNLGFRFANCMFTGSIEGNNINPMPLSTALIKSAVAMKNELAIVGNFQQADYPVRTLDEMDQLLGVTKNSHRMADTAIFTGEIVKKHKNLAVRSLGDEWLGDVYSIYSPDGIESIVLPSEYNHPLIIDHIVRIIEGQDPKIASRYFESALIQIYRRLATLLRRDKIEHIEAIIDGCREEFSQARLNSPKLHTLLGGDIRDDSYNWLQFQALTHRFFGLTEFLEDELSNLKWAIEQQINKTIEDSIANMTYVIHAALFQSGPCVVDKEFAVVDGACSNKKFKEVFFPDAPLDWSFSPTTIEHDNKRWLLLEANHTIYLKGFEGDVRQTDLPVSWFYDTKRHARVYPPKRTTIPTFTDLKQWRKPTTVELMVCVGKPTTRVTVSASDRPSEPITLGVEESHNTLATGDVLIPSNYLINDRAGNTYELVPRYKKFGFSPEETHFVAEANKSNLMPGPIWAAFKASKKAVRSKQTVEGISPEEGGKFVELINKSRGTANQPNQKYKAMLESKQLPAGFDLSKVSAQRKTKKVKQAKTAAKGAPKNPSVSRKNRVSSPATKVENDPWIEAVLNWVRKERNRPDLTGDYGKYIECYVRFPQMTPEQRKDATLMDAILSNIKNKNARSNYLLLAGDEETPESGISPVVPSKAVVVEGQYLDPSTTLQPQESAEGAPSAETQQDQPNESEEQGEGDS